MVSGRAKHHGESVTERGYQPISESDMEDLMPELVVKTDLHLTVFHLLRGLHQGLSRFSGQSRTALLVVENRDASPHVYDPQNLLKDHKREIIDYYGRDNAWKEDLVSLSRAAKDSGNFAPCAELPGTIAVGYCSSGLLYQAWFAEHHPSAPGSGVIARWLKHAAYVLSCEPFRWTRPRIHPRTLGTALEWYTLQAIQGYLESELHRMLGRPARPAIDDILSNIAGISTTYEEGRRASGKLVIVEEELLPNINFLAHFPGNETLRFGNWKHTRKLLSTVQDTRLGLVSDGHGIVGISGEPLPDHALSVEFKSGRGEIFLSGNLVCTVSDGRFYSSRLTPNLEALGTALQGIGLRERKVKRLLGIVSRLAEKAIQDRHGCTLVVDPTETPRDLAGQRLEPPIDLKQAKTMRLAFSMAGVDGALHIDVRGFLHAFGCILDGSSVYNEDHSRGARFNSALRFSAANEHLIPVVISEDRHVFVFLDGVHLTEPAVRPPISEADAEPTPLREWPAS
jgi:hypothetical protein